MSLIRTIVLGALCWTPVITSAAITFGDANSGYYRTEVRLP